MPMPSPDSVAPWQELEDELAEIERQVEEWNTERNENFRAIRDLQLENRDLYNKMREAKMRAAQTSNRISELKNGPDQEMLM